MHKDSLIDFSEPGRKIFVLFGYMQKRKGILQLLYSFKYLDKSIISQVVFYIAGKIDEKIKKEVIQIENGIREIHDNIKLNIWDRYEKDKELVSLITSSDCILAPYQYFTGSSGVILWAAGAGKPIITQDYGLMRRWTYENKLGITTDTANPRKIAEAITKFLKPTNEKLYDMGKMRELADYNTPERFAKVVFEVLIKL